MHNNCSIYIIILQAWENYLKTLTLIYTVENKNASLWIFPWQIPSEKKYQTNLTLSQIYSQITPENSTLLRKGKVLQFYGLPKSLSKIWEIFGQYWT